MGEENAADGKGATSSGRYVSEPITHPASPVSRESDIGGLKVVTIAPGTASQPQIATGTEGDPYLGCTIDGRYKVESLLGEGGMGVVYRCTHKIIGKKVAMKVLRADMARDSEVTERFLNEAKAASSIGNPHIIDISDFGQLPDGSTYFVMEYLEGTPLTDLVQPGKSLDAERILNIAEQLAEGLSAAHQAEIVHRDLKPDNIYLIRRGNSNDFVKILDFGIAKVSTTEGKLTRAGAVFGTPHYMSPEQAAGSPVDHRGDIYSLGVILYELVSGRVPFDADNFMGILTQHIYKSPAPLRDISTLPPSIGTGIEAVVLKCMSKKPQDRYQSMDSLLDDLRRVRAHDAPGAIAELASRPDGFTVPEDYFRSLQGDTTEVTVAKRPGSRVGIVIGGLVAVAALAGAAVFSLGEEAPPPAVSLEPTVEPPVPAPVVAAPAEPVVEPAEEEVVMTQVVLATSPMDAHVYQGDEDLGSSPVVVEVKEGKPVTLLIKRSGYNDEKIVVDGSEKRRSIKLTPIVKTRPAPRPRTPTPRKPATPKKKKNKPTIGGGEIINPWG